MDLPAEPQLRWILSRAATLLEQGAEPVRGLVLPSAEFFPDRFDASPKALAALMTRIQEHAGLSDLEVELAIVSPEGEAQKVSCSTGACGGAGMLDLKLDGVAQLDEGKYGVAIPAGQVRSPLVLTTTLVRAVSAMFLTEADAYRGTPLPDRQPLTDLAGALLGFGVLLANGSYIYAKGCSGVHVQSATAMPADELGVALGLFCRLFDVPARTARQHLELTPGEHFDEGYAWASSNASVVRLLRKDPEAVRAGSYTLSPAHSWLARVLGLGQKRRTLTPDEELAELERSLPSSAQAKKREVDAAKAKKLAELKALVDESLER
jgi:hypothetical protein